MSEVREKQQLMTSEERKAKYRDLLDRAEILQENEETGLETTIAIDEILQKANLLFKDSNIKERTKHTDEVLLDAKVVATASDVLLSVTEAIDCAVDTYEPQELARKIRSKLLTTVDEDSESEINWSEINKISKNILMRPPNFKFLYGVIGKPTVAPKPPKVRQPREKLKKSQQQSKKQPEKITKVDKEEDSVDDTVKFMQWALTKEYEENGGQPLNYYLFTVDPEDYSHTIENIFHLSFLFRDGRATINTDPEGIVQVIPLSSHDAKKARKTGVAYKQNIISIDMNEWQEVIETFGIQQNFLKKWKNQWERKKN